MALSNPTWWDLWNSFCNAILSPTYSLPGFDTAVTTDFSTKLAEFLIAKVEGTLRFETNSKLNHTFTMLLSIRGATPRYFAAYAP